MYLYIYNKETGTCHGVVSGRETFDNFTFHYSEKDRVKLGWIYVESIPRPINNYKVVDGMIKERTVHEVEDIEKYGKVLSESERLLYKLKPSQKEVQKADNTIEVLSLLQEVL